MGQKVAGRRFRLHTLRTISDRPMIPALSRRHGEEPIAAASMSIFPLNYCHLMTVFLDFG